MTLNHVLICPAIRCTALHKAASTTPPPSERLEVRIACHAGKCHAWLRHMNLLASAGIARRRYLPLEDQCQSRVFGCGAVDDASNLVDDLEIIFIVARMNQILDRLEVAWSTLRCVFKATKIHNAAKPDKFPRHQKQLLGETTCTLPQHDRCVVLAS
eukprot:4692535-Amphidinium_carterae.1